MYSNKFIIVFCVVGVVSAYYSNENYNENNKDLREIDSIYNEQPCQSHGGICTIADDCPNLAEQRGLCPNQQLSKGVECCYGISRKETRCQRRGGSCMEECNPSLVDSIATDCPKHNKCCILVN